MNLCWRLFSTLPWTLVVAVAIASAGTTCHAFHLHAPSFTSSRTSFRSCRSTSICTRYAESVSSSVREEKDATLTSTTTGAANRRNKCGYLFEGRWEQRKNLADLEIGDKLFGRKLDGRDLLEAKTGPKIFFECGVARLDAEGNWHMVNGMLRLGRRGARKSATKKRVARMTDKAIDLFVSRIDTATGRLEVTTSLEKAEEAAGTGDKKTPASSLKAGDELIGTVVEVRDYGVFVDVGANRLGLLHIQRVADLFDRYIKKAEGLAEAGLERGAQIRVAVVTNEKKRLFLDFTPDVKNEAETKRKDRQRERDEAAEKKAARRAAEMRDKEEKAKPKASASENGDELSGISADEAAAWAAYGASDDDDVADWAAFAAGDDSSAYDEDDDIEDALGIGSYR
mmetsp:Transcript_3297/g.7229  ORF Transcript_3297/g.7229 Transcript_3297/m.7229 type:complete len:398 (+) Transcript_3297:49-1242(+)